MSGKDLIDSLRRAAEDKIGMMRREAEAAAEALRNEFADRIRQMRAERARGCSAAGGAALATRVNEANDQARRSRLDAEQALSGRLFMAAKASLRNLRDEGYPRVFEQLAHELPALQWSLVRVNPGDIDPAKRAFPRAEIVPDETISGGMDASTQGGEIRVINTLETRLERAWPDLLPALIRLARQEEDHGSSADS